MARNSDAAYAHHRSSTVRHLPGARLIAALRTVPPPDARTAPRQRSLPGDDLPKHDPPLFQVAALVLRHHLELGPEKQVEPERRQALLAMEAAGRSRLHYGAAAGMAPGPRGRRYARAPSGPSVAPGCPSPQGSPCFFVPVGSRCPPAANAGTMARLSIADRRCCLSSGGASRRRTERALIRPSTARRRSSGDRRRS